MNSLKHGMTARRPVLPGEDEAAFCRFVNDVSDALGPCDAVEVVLAEQVALATWKIARAERCEAARVAFALRAAEADADIQAHDEVAAMGHWLLTDTLRGRQNAAASLFPFLSEDRHDPFRRGRGDPRHIVLRLEATAEGCRWLLEQWARLGRRLERGHDWRTNELIVALHLRGQRPLGADLLEWGGLLESTPADGEPEVVAQARRALQLQLDEGVPRDPAGQRAALGRLVREETERLQRRKADHERREAADRADLVDRLAVDTTAEGERMRRYQLDFDRKLHRALNSLLKLRRASAVATGPDPGAIASDPTESVRPAIADPDGPGAGPELAAPPSADAATCGTSPADRDASEPDCCPVPQNEPTPPIDSDRIPQDEPALPAVNDGIPRNEPTSAASGIPIAPDEPTTPAAGDRIPRNEPSPPAGGDPIAPDGPTGSGRIADRRVPALACAMVILLAAGLSAAFAGPIGRPTIPADGRSSPAAARADADGPGPGNPSIERKAGDSAAGASTRRRRTPSSALRAPSRASPASLPKVWGVECPNSWPWRLYS